MSRKPTGFVYFVQTEGQPFIKIGFSAEDPDSRIASLQCGCPFRLVRLGLIRADVTMESKLHRRFARHLERGEWFRAEASLRVFIRRYASEWLPGASRDIQLNPELYCTPLPGPEVIATRFLIAKMNEWMLLGLS